MAEARRVIPDIDFNGKSAKKSLDGLTEQIEYDDVASGASDTLSIQVFNKDMKFLKGWLPKKGDRITASLTFKNWTKEGADKKLSCGDFLLDEMKMTGGPLVATLGGISIPTNSAIKSTNRTKTWKKVSIKQIAQEIAKRYGLKLIFDGPNYTIKSIEQTDKSDSSFLYDLCKDYGLGMKVYKNKIVIWGKSKYEGKKATATIKRADFIGDDWDYTDTLEGTYTGARTSYKKGNDSKEISIYVGLVGEKAKGARTLKISEQSDSENDARYKAAAKVNLENEKATVLTFTFHYVSINTLIHLCCPVYQHTLHSTMFLLIPRSSEPPINSSILYHILSTMVFFYLFIYFDITRFTGSTILLMFFTFVDLS